MMIANFSIGGGYDAKSNSSMVVRDIDGKYFWTYRSN
jgi:hypothetical protein